MSGDETVVVCGPVRGLQRAAAGRGLVLPRVPGPACLRAVAVARTRRGAVAAVAGARRLGLGDPGPPDLLVTTPGTTPMSPPRVLPPVTRVLRHVHEAVFPTRGRVEAERVHLADDAAHVVLPGVGGPCVPVVMVSPVQQGRGVGHEGGAPGGHVDLALVSVEHPVMPVVRRGHELVTLPGPGHGHVVTLVTPLSKVQVPIYITPVVVTLSLHLVTAIKFKCPRVIEFNFTILRDDNPC